MCWKVVREGTDNQTKTAQEMVGAWMGSFGRHGQAQARDEKNNGGQKQRTTDVWRGVVADRQETDRYR